MWGRPWAYTGHRGAPWVHCIVIAAPQLLIANGRQEAGFPCDGQYCSAQSNSSFPWPHPLGTLRMGLM